MSSNYTSAPPPNKVSPTGTREIMDQNKVMRVSEENKQVLSAVEALLSLTPVVAGEQELEAGQQDEATPSSEAPRDSALAAAIKESSSRISTAIPSATTMSYTAGGQRTSKTITTTKTTTTAKHAPVVPRAAGTVSPCDSSVEYDNEEEPSQHGERPTTATTNDEMGGYFEGSCDLWCPEDEECLSPLHCFMRKYCVEAFTAKAYDISTPKFGRSLGRSIAVGQLGIQCKWCKHRNYSDRQERAVCFPSTIKNIYHSIETWQRRHSTVCGDIPPWAKTQMTNLMKCSRSGAGGRRLYWEESAKRLGMIDTDSGVRFFRPPGTIDPPPIKNTLPLQQLSVTMTPCDNGSVEISMDVDGTNALGHNKVITIDTTVSHAIVREDDLELQITGYLFCLLEQMESCYFSDEDRIGGRSKVKSCQTGYPGIQCKHCGGKSGFGRYFPASCAALSSANSDRNIFNHISKCRKCPEEVRDRLTSLFKQQSTFKNRRGTRKIFFERIWARMHQQEEPDLPTMRKSNKHEAILEELPSPMLTVRENDTASAPVWQEPPPPPPPAPRPKPTVPPPRPQHRPIPQPQYQVQQPHQVQQHQIPHQQQQLQQHQVQQQHRPEELVPLQQQQHRPQDLVPLQPPQVFQEVPQQASIVQHVVPRRVDQDMILQPMTMMMVPIQDLPMMHQQQTLVHEQRIHQQLQLRNMQHHQQQLQQQHHPSLVVLQQQQMQAPHHQQQHHQAMVQQQHAMQQQQQQHHFQRQQQQPQHHHLMVPRPTAQRAYLPHPNMQFAAMLDQQQSQVATAAAVPYLHHQHHPYANSNTNMQPPVSAAAVPYSTYQPARQHFRLPSDGTTNISAV